MKSVTSPFTKVCVYDRPHGDVKTAFSKVSTLESVFECMRLKRRLRVDARCKRIRMYAFTDVKVYVWTGPEILAL